MPKFNRKLVQTEPFQVIRDSAGRVIKVIFPHQVEFGFENDSNFQGQVSFKNSDPVDAKGGKINSEATSGNFNLTSDGIGTALGFTPVKGYGCLQEDDIMRSKTVAKITEDIDWANVLDTLTYEGISYKHFLATCTFHCG